jgi:hypothetical protein
VGLDETEATRLYSPHAHICFLLLIRMGFHPVLLHRPV